MDTFLPHTNPYLFDWLNYRKIFLGQEINYINSLSKRLILHSPMFKNSTCVAI